MTVGAALSVEGAERVSVVEIVGSSSLCGDGGMSMVLGWTEALGLCVELAAVLVSVPSVDDSLFGVSLGVSVRCGGALYVEVSVSMSVCGSVIADGLTGVVELYASCACS